LGGDFRRQVIRHYGQWSAAGPAQPSDECHVAVLGHVEFTRDLLVGRSDVVVQHLCAWPLSGVGEVVEQTGQLDPPVHRTLHDLGPNAAFANQQTTIDKLLDCAANGRARQHQPLRKSDFVFEPIPWANWPSRIAASMA
jgi:hypothetical protein